jgi:hypothetical protein
MIGPGILAAEQPGFLRLPLDKERQLISSEPLDACYHVDEEPFARSVSYYFFVAGRQAPPSLRQR